MVKRFSSIDESTLSALKVNEYRGLSLLPVCGMKGLKLNQVLCLTSFRT